MRILLFAICVCFGLNANASDCANGRCGLQPIRSSAKVVGEVVGEVYSATKNVTKNVVKSTKTALSSCNKCCKNRRCRRR